MNELAKRAVACKHWRWMPGMKWLLPEGAEGYWPLSYRSGRYPEVPEGVSVIPDLTDPATLGCLLVLVAEAYNCSLEEVYCVRHTGGAWAVWQHTSDQSRRRRSPLLEDYLTRAEALVAAVEAVE